MEKTPRISREEQTQEKLRLGLGLPGMAYMAFSALSSFNIGAYLVLLAWSAAELTGDASLVATLFMMSLVVGAVAANVAGVFSDGSNTRDLLLGANVLRSLGAFGLCAALALGTHESAAILCFAVVRTLANAVIMTAGAVVFQQIFATSVRSRRVAEVGIVRQAGIALGTGITGLLIAMMGAPVTSLVLAVVTLMQTPLILLFAQRTPETHVTPPGTGPRALLHRWAEGFGYLRVRPDLLVSVVILAASFSVSQLTNVLVPVFVSNDLGASAEVYGALEMAWAVGGSLALVGARVWLKGQTAPIIALYLLALTGLGMAVFASGRSVWVVISLYSVLGGLFCLTRFVADSHILTETETSLVGRVRAVNLLLTNAIGVAIFTLPFLVPTGAVSRIYIAWGLLLMAICGGLALMRSMARSAAVSGPNS